MLTTKHVCSPALPRCNWALQFSYGPWQSLAGLSNSAGKHGDGPGNFWRRWIFNPKIFAACLDNELGETVAWSDNRYIAWEIWIPRWRRQPHHNGFTRALVDIYTMKTVTLLRKRWHFEDMETTLHCFEKNWSPVSKTRIFEIYSQNSI
jgi:hypothetical protein